MMTYLMVIMLPDLKLDLSSRVQQGHLSRGDNSGFFFAGVTDLYGDKEQNH